MRLIEGEAVGEIIINDKLLMINEAQILMKDFSSKQSLYNLIINVKFVYSTTILNIINENSQPNKS